MKTARCVIAALSLVLLAQSAGADAFFTKKSGSAVDITVWKAVRSGGISISNGSAEVVGTGTQFSKIYLPASGYARITDSSGTVELGTVSSIESDTHLTLAAVSGFAYEGAFTTESLPTIDDDLTINAGNSITALSAEVGSSAFGIHDLTLDGVLTTDVIYLQITGDLTLNTGSTLATDPNTRLVFDGVSTIGGSAPIGINYLRVKSPGVVTLTKNITVTNILEMEGGTIVTGSDTLTLGTSIDSTGTFQLTGPGAGISGMITGTMKRWFSTDPVTFTCTDGLFPLGVGTSFRKVWIAKANQAAGSITVTHADDPSTTPFGAPFVENAVTFDTRHNMRWTIAAGDGFSGTSDLRIQVSGFDAAAYLPDKLTLSLSANEASGAYAAPSIVGSDTVVNRTGLSAPQLSNTFYIASGYASLPVELASFTAAARSGMIVLQWKTATEKNSRGFEIERSRTGSGSSASAWTKVGYVDGHGTTSAPQAYTFSDLVAGGTYAYRLKQIDRDGGYEYSRAVEATTALLASEYGLSQNFPNPFNPSTSIQFALDATQHAVLKVYNTLGQEVCTLFNGMAEGQTVHSVTFDAQSLPSGMYFYTLHGGARSEVKKMQLVR
jgi:hypothetical protein